MTRDELAEVVARAICENGGQVWARADADEIRWWRGDAKAALTAIEDAGMVVVPREATDGLLMSMAIRDDHGLGVPGYYDQEIFGAMKVTHAQRVMSALRTMRKLYEEVVGTGFYNADREADYLARIPMINAEGEG